MHRTLPEKPSIFAFACATLLLACATSRADDYRDARTEMVAAYQDQDFPAMRAAAIRSLDARPGYAGALFNLALAEVLNGDASASLRTLEILLNKKIDFGADEMDEFAPLHELPEWGEYTSAVAELYKPVGKATVAYRHNAPDFIPEGIALARDGGLYLGSIRHGDIVQPGVEAEVIATAAVGPHWSVFGMRHDGDRTLWFVSAAIDEFAALNADDAGKTGLFALDINTGELKVRALLPPTGNKQILGDLVLADDDTIYMADQFDGLVYQYTISSGEFSTLVERGKLGSPQGLVLDDSGEHLYVADYIGGLYRVKLVTGDVEHVTPLATASDYGIDGLYRHGNKIIAIQNGVRPNRVIEFELSRDGRSVVSSRILAMNLPEFDEPNLGVIRGNEFLFIANSHWNRFDRELNLPADMEGPVILSIDLGNAAH